MGFILQGLAVGLGLPYIQLVKDQSHVTHVFHMEVNQEVDFSGRGSDV